MSAKPTEDVEFCREALQEALARFGRPEIFNTDQGSQFTSPRFTVSVSRRPRHWRCSSDCGFGYCVQNQGSRASI